LSPRTFSLIVPLYAPRLSEIRTGLAFPPGANAAPDAISARVAANRSLFRERESKLQIETCRATWLDRGGTYQVSDPFKAEMREQINESQRRAQLAG
jgi:hypothetical protein